MSRPPIYKNNPNRQQEEENPWELIEGRESKTEKKRAFIRTTQLAEKLTGLSLKQLKQLPMSEETMFRFEEMTRIKSFEARRRQAQLLAKRLQHEDESAIIEVLMQKNGNMHTTVRKWIDRFLTQKDLAIFDFSKQYKAEAHSARIYLLTLQRALEEQGEDSPEAAAAERAIGHYVFQVIYLSML
jgi:ribosomal 50S subunit-associated protein YjgA (DUF615 family)